MNFQENTFADVVVALGVSLLLFTNPTVTAASHRWVVNSKDLGGIAEADVLKLMPDEEDNNAGTILVPPCCLPLCFFQGRYVLHGFESYEEQLQQLSKRVAERAEAAEQHEHRCRESEVLLENVRNDLEHMNRLRQSDQEHLTNMCLEERKKRVAMEETLESTRRETGKTIEEQRIRLEQEQKKRQDAEAQKASASKSLLSMSEIVE